MNKDQRDFFSRGAKTRIYPCTMATIKQLLLVYDKPMIYHPLATLMFAGIREILFISTQEDTLKFETILGDRKHLGLSFSYKFREN